MSKHADTTEVCERCDFAGENCWRCDQSFEMCACGPDQEPGTCESCDGRGTVSVTEDDA